MVDVLAFGSHPDDVEFGCGGILAKMASQKKSIVIVDLTSGEKGTYGTPEVRRKEGEKSAELIGAKRVYLDFKDCEVLDTYEGRLKLVEVLRTFKPNIILAPLWEGTQNHPDHLATGIMARYATRYSRFAKILPHLPIHRPGNILHYLYPINVPPDFLIDISSGVETWKKMMACHESQVHLGDYAQANLSRAATLGLMIGVPYAQGLVKGNPVHIEDIMTIAKGTREI